MFTAKIEPPIVISVGGSLIVPNGGVDTLFLTKLNKIIRSHVIKGKRFLLVAGGGRIARHYRDAAKDVIGNISNEDLDWLAIHTTRLNAHLLRTVFQDIANPRIVENYDKKINNWSEPVAIGAGWKPGWSTDYCAVVLAKQYRANVIINLSNIDVVYDRDPNKYKNARPIEKITWDEMANLVGDKWTPGLNVPFDPIATALARSLQLTAIVTNGQDFKNLDNIIEGEPFKGTVIMPLVVDSGFYDHDYYRGKKGGHRAGMVESFWGAVFHNIVNFLRALMIKIVVNPKNCLDVGCGLGYLVRWMRFLGIEAYGLDFSPVALKLAHPDVKRYIKVADIENIPYKNNHFDLVMSYNFLQHLERSKIRKAISETVRVSRRHVYHKILTPDNFWYRLFHKKDFSNVSFFYKKYWQKLFGSIDSVSQIKAPFGFLDAYDARFLLKKKS